MKKCENPCFDCWYTGDPDKDYLDLVCECFCDSEDPNECAHLNDGGTWKDCLSGGEFKYLKEYQDRCSKGGI